MQALIVLAREHEAIARIVAELETRIDACATRATVDGEVLQRLLDFFENVVDGHHQEKEERVLLPCVTLRAEDEDGILAATLLADHGAERELLASMRRELEGAAYGEASCTAALVDLARRYIGHQREHSRWESTVVFPLAGRCLTRSDDLALLAEFRRLDLAFGSSVVHAACALEDWLGQPAHAA